MLTSQSDYLEHHGVKGMRWGHRRFRPQVKTDSLGRTRGLSKTKKATEMSDDELRERINRMRLERDYNSLKKESTLIGAGATFCNKQAQSIVSGVVVGAVVAVGKNYLIDKMKGN